MFKTMLMAVSATDADLPCLRYAAMLSRLLPDLAIAGVHVASSPDAEDGRLKDLLQTRCSQTLPAVSWEVVCSDVLDGLIERAVSHGADVVLLGHSGRRGRRSLARRLAMKAPCSVWMVPAGSPPGLHEILVPVDLSKPSADTLELATALAAQAGLEECLALHVFFNDAPVTFDEFEEKLIEDKELAFDLFVAPIDLHGVHARCVFIESASVARTILAVAAERASDLIVMGTRGRSRSAAILLGSETEQVMIDTRVPVLVVKHRGAHLRLRQALADKRVMHGSGLRFS